MEIKELVLEFDYANIYYINSDFPLESRVEVVVYDRKQEYRYRYNFITYNFNNSIFNSVMFTACWNKSIEEGLFNGTDIKEGASYKVKYCDGTIFNLESVTCLGH